MTNLAFDALFGRHAGSEKPFLFLDDGTVLTYAAFLARVGQFAHAITDLGLRVGDRLAVQIEKSPEALAVYGACLQTGVVFLPLNTAYTAQEMSYFVGDSGAKLILCDQRRAAALGDVVAAHGAALETLNGDNSGSFTDLANDKLATFATVDRGRDDLAAFLYTSGTTGRSKGAMLTQGNLVSNAKTLAQEWQFNPDDVLLHALPIYHTHGLFVATNVTLITGSSMRFMSRFDVDMLIDEMAQATTMMGVPTFYTRLLDAPRFSRKKAERMRLFISGSAPLLHETHIQFEALSGHKILERYGMTETNMNTSNPYVGARKAGTVGLPLPGIEVIVTDPATGAPLPQGEIGQIEVRGPNVFKGYWNMPEKTAEELRENGFFMTGDLGQIDKDGYVSIVGRDKDLIISGGFNIYPKEIEELLDKQPGVLESAVIGIPHADFGETPLALIVMEKGAILDRNAIQSNIATSLARFKHPSDVIEIASLPRNTMGKVQKKKLREEFQVKITQ